MVIAAAVMILQRRRPEEHDDAARPTTVSNADFDGGETGEGGDGFDTWPLKRVAGSVHATDLEQAGCNKGALCVVISATDADDVTTNADAMYEFAAASGTDADAVTTNADAIYEDAAANAWTDGFGTWPLKRVAGSVHATDLAEPDYDRPANDVMYDNTAAVPAPVYGVPEEPSADVYGLGPTQPTSADVYGLGPTRPTSEVYQMANHSDAANRNSDYNDVAEFYPMAMQDDAAGQAAGVGTADGAPGPAYSIATFDRRGSGGGYRAPKQRAVTGDYSNVVIDVDDGVDGVYGLQRDGHGSTYGNPRQPDAAEGNYGLGD